MNKTVKKVKRIAKKLILKKGKFFLRRMEKFFLKELKEEDFDKAILDLAEKLKIKEIIQKDSKPIAVGGLVMVVFIWAVYNLFAPVAHSEEKDIANPQVKEDLELSISEESEINKIHAKTLNEYKLKSSEKKCEEDSSQKYSSNLCGKDDEKEIERQKAEKRKTLMVKRKPVIKAPGPYVFEKDSLGRKVCNKKNDHPGKSKQNKKGHMDMECCLDPDEIPNPHCYYDPGKYGKYLK